MIRIALIDDSPTDIEIGQRFVKSYFESREDARDMELSFTTYLDGPSFLSEFEEGKFDLIFTCLTWTALRRRRESGRKTKM